MTRRERVLASGTTEISGLIERSGLSKQEIAARTGYSIRTVYRWRSGETAPKKTVIEWLSKQVSVNGRYKPAERPAFTFIDLFAGIGGFRIGFESIGGRCVFTSEWDSPCRATYHANFPCTHPVEGDITAVPEKEIPAHDILLAGFPCQPFSIAGVSKKNALGMKHGFADTTQGTLFFDAARIIAHHQPAAFLLENVKNLINHDRGNTFQVIRKTLEVELGYHIDWRVINAKGFVPQNRERIFIAGFRENTGFDFSKLEVPDSESGPVLRSILHPQNGSEPEDPPYTFGLEGKVDPKYTLTKKLWSYLKSYAAKHKSRGNGFGYGLVGPDDTSRTLSARYYKDGSEILVHQHRKRPRRLTPRECARLMGFDGRGRPRFEIPVSDTQAYKQFGNSVVVPVVETIARFMRSHILTVMANEWRQTELDLEYASAEEEPQAANA